MFTLKNTNKSIQHSIPLPGISYSTYIVVAKTALLLKRKAPVAKKENIKKKKKKKKKKHVREESSNEGTKGYIEKIGVEMRQAFKGASLVAHMVENLPAMQEPGVQPLGQKDPLEKRMATHSSILSWRIQSTDGKKSDTTQQLSE